MTHGGSRREKAGKELAARAALAVRKPWEHKARKLHTHSHTQMEAGLDLQARDFSEVKGNESAKRRPRVPLSNLNDFQAEFCIRNHCPFHEHD